MQHIYQIILKFQLSIDVQFNTQKRVCLDYSYKWEMVSKEKLFDATSDVNELNDIASFENIEIRDSYNALNNASEKLTNIFEKFS